MKPRPLVIFGTGSLARMAHYYATRELGLQVLGFTVDPAYRPQDGWPHGPVWDWPQMQQTHRPADVSVFVAVGYRSMLQRASTWQRVRDAGYETPALVSRHAFVAEGAVVGANSIVMPGAVVEPCVTLGANNVLWSNVTVCHDAVVGDHNFLASNATVGGEARIGSRCFLGFSSVVAQQRTVGDDVLLAAQSLLLDDAASLTRYQGAPARAAAAVDRHVGVRVD